MTDPSQGAAGGQGFVPPTPAPTQPSAGTAAVQLQPIPAGQLFDQLARIEDKCSRIEDKYARSEALLSRVEDRVETATTRMNEGARQADLAALRNEVRGLSERTRRLPGTGALVLTAIVAAVLTVVLMVAVQRLNLDRLLPPGASSTATQ